MGFMTFKNCPIG
jgi:hypothetical protein